MCVKYIGQYIDQTELNVLFNKPNMSIVATFKSQRISGWTRLESGRSTIIDHHEMETEQKLTERKA